MHQFFVTLCSLLVALCHHTSLTAHPVEAAELPGAVQSGADIAGSGPILPDRYQLARITTSDGGYSVTECSSCRRINLVSVDR